MAQASAPSTSRPSARLGSAPDDTSDSRRFLQSRLALLYSVAFYVSSAFFAVSLLLEARGLGRAPLDPFWLSGRTVHLLTIAGSLGLWGAMRYLPPLGVAALEWFDAFATLLLCGAYVALGWTIGHGQAVGLLAGTHIVVTRSILVPSTARRTFWISSAALATIPWEAWLRAKLDVALLHGTDAAAGPLLAFVDRLLWCAAAVVVSTVASRVIYGLQERVREARQLGQYTLLEKIGQGGMGQVFKASHALLRRPTAIKLLDPDNVDRTRIRRFEREVQLTSALTHPNTISIYDFGHTPDGVFYYAMELLDGFNLEELVERSGPQDEGRVIHILRQVCGALQEAHDVGLIHRDIKPANIHLCCRGGIPDVVKVLDFGLVKETRTPADLTLSHSEIIAGTPMYMPPEAIAAPDKVDARSDLYALGAVAYYLLTATPVFAARSVIEVCSLHLHERPEPPSKRLTRPICADLELLVMQCLSKQPGERPSSARSLARDLGSCASATSWTTEKAERWWSSKRDVSKALATTVSMTVPMSTTAPTVEVDVRRRVQRRPTH